MPAPLSSPTTDVDALKAEGIALHKRGTFPAALHAFALASSAAPTRPDVAANLSDVLFSLERYAEAAFHATLAAALASSAGDTHHATTCTSRAADAAALAPSPPPVPAADLKARGLAAYTRRDLHAAVDAFSAAAAADAARPDIAANLAAALFELGRYRDAAAQCVLASIVARAAGDVKREAVCNERMVRAEAFLRREEEYDAARTRHGPEALPPITRAPVCEGSMFYPLGHEQPVSFLIEKGAWVRGLENALISCYEPLWMQKGQWQGEFSVLLAAASDPRHLMSSLRHLGTMMEEPTGEALEKGMFPLRIQMNDRSAQVMARNILFFALLLEVPLRKGDSDVDGGWDCGVPPAMAAACAHGPEALHFSMTYALLAAHNLSPAQWTLLQAALKRNIAAAASAETWTAAYGVRFALDDDTRLAVRQEWQRWLGKPRKMSSVKRAEPNSCTAPYASDAPMRCSPAERLKEMKSQGAGKETIALKILETLEKRAKFEAGETRDATISLSTKLRASLSSGLVNWTQKQVDNLFITHVPETRYCAWSQQKYFFPYILEEIEFYDYTLCVLPPEGTEDLPTNWDEMSLEDVDEIFVFNPSFYPSKSPSIPKLAPTELDPFHLAHGEIEDGPSGTVAWLAVEKLRSLSDLLGKLLVDNDWFSITFSCADMFEVFSNSSRCAFDRILVSNVPDYTGWSVFFNLAFPLLKRSPQTLLIADCLRNPFVFSTYEMQLEALSMVPWSWTQEKHGLEIVFGNTMRDSVFLGSMPNVGEKRVNFEKSLSELGRLLSRSLFVTPPHVVRRTSHALEVLSSTSSALALWSLVVRKEVPLHKLGEWLSNIVKTGVLSLDCPKSENRAETARPFSSEAHMTVSISPILLDFFYATSEIFGAGNPFKEIIPTTFEALTLRNSANCCNWSFQRGCGDDPAVQICLLFCENGSSVVAQAEELLACNGDLLGRSIRRGIQAMNRNANLSFYVWTTAYRVDWKQTDPMFKGAIALELFVPNDLAAKLRILSAEAKWFGLGTADAGNICQLQLS